MLLGGGGVDLKTVLSNAKNTYLSLLAKARPTGQHVAYVITSNKTRTNVDDITSGKNIIIMQIYATSKNTPIIISFAT